MYLLIYIHFKNLKRQKLLLQINIILVINLMRHESIFHRAFKKCIVIRLIEDCTEEGTKIMSTYPFK